VVTGSDIINNVITAEGGAGTDTLSISILASTFNSNYAVIAGGGTGIGTNNGKVTANPSIRRPSPGGKL